MMYSYIINVLLTWTTSFEKLGRKSAMVGSPVLCNREQRALSKCAVELPRKSVLIREVSWLNCIGTQQSVLIIHRVSWLYKMSWLYTVSLLYKMSWLYNVSWLYKMSWLYTRCPDYKGGHTVQINRLCRAISWFTAHDSLHASKKTNYSPLLIEKLRFHFRSNAHKYSIDV